MKAMILAAGLGTRLKPITDTIPKALVKINGRPMLDILLQRLIRSGFNEIIVNVHYFAGQVKDYLEQIAVPGVHIEISDESDQLLDTGGAILKARSFLDGNEPFLVHNADVICDIDLKALIKSHQGRGYLATLVVSKRQSSRYFLMDRHFHLKGWENISTGERILVRESTEDLQKLAFSGIHIINPDIFRLMTQEGKFSIIQTYLQLAVSHLIFGYLHDPELWIDLGKKEHLRLAEIFLRNHPEY